MSAARRKPDEILRTAATPLVFCPLGFERRAFMRFGKLPVVTTGPGADAIRHAFAQRDRWPIHTPRLVLLLGLAGALDDDLHAGTAVFATHVTRDGGGELRSALWHRGCSLEGSSAFAPGRTPECLRIAETEAPATTPAEKTALRTATGAHLVDTESHAFAECATAAGIAWVVVRGISDGAGDTLPPEVADFVDARGETRPLRVLGAIARRPALLGELARLARRSRTAMRDASFLADSLACVPPLELSSPANPLLLFGGSFDPPHARHATLLADAMRALRSPAAIVMPAAINPLKTATPPADPDARLAMCRATFSTLPEDLAGEVRLSPLELERDGPSYTVDTVADLVERHPFLAGAIRFLVGSDAIRSIERWSRWRTLLELARPAIVVRPPDTRESVARFLAEFARTSGFSDAPSWLLDLPPVDLASTAIRDAIARGEPLGGIDGLSDGVRREIAARRLYGFGEGR
ncbi:MAG: Nicotinate-nucleotide adenylyltransferase [Planctomycetota bacterium]